MTLYAGRMPTYNTQRTAQAGQELRDAVTSIMSISDIDTAFMHDGRTVTVELFADEAIELAEWIRSRTHASVDNPLQGQFSFTTE